MLEENKKPEKEAKNEPEVKKANKVITKDYTVLKSFTTDKVNNPGDTVSIEVGSDHEKYLLTNKIINKHGISRPN